MVAPSSCCPKTLCPPVWVTSPHLKLPCPARRPPPPSLCKNTGTSHKNQQYRGVPMVCINRSRFALVKTMIKSSITMLPIQSQEKNHHDFNYARKEDNVSNWWQWKQMTRKRAFSHAFGSFPVFTLSSHWPMMVLSFVIIGWSDYIGFEFLTVNWKLHKCNTKFPSLAYRNCFILLR